jgi:phage-related tail fiber protein
MSSSQVITNIGLAKIAAALSGGPRVVIQDVAVGDADTAPDPALTALGNEVWRAVVNAVDQTPGDPNRVRIEGMVPIGDGGWWMREAAAFDADGDMIVIARIPDSYKPNPGTDGAGLVAYIRLIVAIANAFDALALTVDDSVVMASRLDVDEATTGSKLYEHAHFS